MAGRKRAYSDVSGDEMEMIERVQCLTVDTALKPVAKTMDPNDWPCFVLEDACVYNQDGKTIANMLHAELRGPFIVRGKLIVDKDQRKCLAHKTSEGQYVEIGNCQGFSIGYEPTVLWASGKAGWFEIKPSVEYKPIHDKMIEGISLYFIVTLLFEKLMQKKSSKKNHKTLSAEQVLLQYAISEGTGLVKAEVEHRFREHGEFLLSQMGKPSDGGINWKTTNFYKWVEAQCPDVAQLMKTKGGERETNDSARGREPGEVTVRNVFVSEPSSSRTIAHISRPKPTKPVKPAKQRVEESSIQPLDFQDDNPDDSESASPAVLILRVLNKLVTNEKSRNRLTLTRVGTELYYDYSFSNYQLKEWIVKAYAKPVFAALTEDWKDSPFYKSLKDFLAQKEPKNELFEEAKQYVFKARVKKDPSAGAGKTKNASQHSTKAEKKPSRETSTESPGPVSTTGKSLPHTMSGRRSGKEAGLRLATSPTKRPHSPDASGDEGFEAIRRRQRKRRRPSLEPELGSPNEVEEPDILDGDANDEAEPDTVMTIVAEPLPSATPTGPNGMWTCHKEGCDFVIRAADEEEGKQKIQEHLGEHAELIARETLVLQEARPHLPVSHLLDKLRKLGEEAKKSDEKARPTINGIIVPQPIKRHGMYT